MKCDLDQFSNYFDGVINRHTKDKKVFREVTLKCLDNHNIPVDITADILTSRKKISEYGKPGIFYAYCILEAISECGYPLKITNYYTDAEIRYFSGEKYLDNTEIEFPIVFKCVRVAEDQYIGASDAQTLVKMGRNNLIRYNVETQRTMRRIVRGESVEYKISIDKNALREIRRMFVAGEYIPNTITLNIPEGQGDFYYNEKTSELVINQIDKFDITDGYHRYQAMISVIMEDPQFNCQIELRIQNFGVDKANNFIWQEDRKTKMKKVDSDSFNMNEFANRVTKRVNDAADSNLHGLIARSQTIINFSWFASCVRYYFLKRADKPENLNVYIIDTSKRLIRYFNAITEYDSSLLLNEWDFVDMTILFYLEGVLPEDKLDIATQECKKIRKRLEETVNMARFSNKQMRGTIYNVIDNAYNEIK